MAEMHLEEKKAPAAPPRRSFLWRGFPFIVVLLLSIVGVAYMNLANKALVGYWEMLAVAVGVLCVVMNWDKAEDRRARYRLIGVQALHWAAILFTMNMVLYSNLQQMLTAPATSLVLVTLLALGTFLAGINLMSLEICFLGLAMALAVPAIVWFKQAALFLFLGALLVLGLLVALWPRRRAKEPAISQMDA